MIKKNKMKTFHRPSMKQTEDGRQQRDGEVKIMKKEGRVCRQKSLAYEYVRFTLRKEANQGERTYALPTTPPATMSAVAAAAAARSVASLLITIHFTTNSHHNNCRGVACGFFLFVLVSCIYRVRRLDGIS